MEAPGFSSRLSGINSPERARELGSLDSLPEVSASAGHHNRSGETGQWRVEQEDGRAVRMPE